MSVKLEGFVCDNCRTFRTFEGVASESLDGIFQKDGNELGPNLIFHKIEGWKYYHVDEHTHMGKGWIRWADKAKCYCPKCDRKLKLKKVIPKI